MMGKRAGTDGRANEVGTERAKKGGGDGECLGDSYPYHGVSCESKKR
jgi:hypothetical protein